MKNIITKILILSFCTCFSQASKQKDNRFFDFNNVEHYTREIAEDVIYKIQNNGEFANSSERDFIKVVEDDYPKEISDRQFITNLKKFKFRKKIISLQNLKEVGEIFSKKDCSQGDAAACIPVYRDIFVFKKDEKIVGIAKICFGCRLFHIVGSRYETTKFGNCGDFDKLKKLINYTQVHSGYMAGSL